MIQHWKKLDLLQIAKRLSTNKCKSQPKNFKIKKREFTAPFLITNTKNPLEMTKLNKIFDLYKENEKSPTLQVQINVDYNLSTNEVKATSILLYCHDSKSFMNMTAQIDNPFCKAIVDREINTTDWRELYIAETTFERNQKARIADIKKSKAGRFPYTDEQPTDIINH